MQQRTCPVCGDNFTPRQSNQRCCPPTDEDRARCPGRARSQCAKRWLNHQQRGTPLIRGKVGQPFDCAHCETHRTPGVDVAHHATRYCNAECKRAHWVAEHPDKVEASTTRATTKAQAQRLLASFTSYAASDGAAYRRAMRRDPCAYCGERAGALDHIVPHSAGGDDGWDNRTAACHRCNNLKQSLPLLTALLWVPTARQYHAMRRELFAA